MLSLTNRDDVTAALTDPRLCPRLKSLVGLRVWQVDTDLQRPLSEVLQIFVIQPGDITDTIHAALGWPICHELAEQPAWEWINDHGDWFELAYIFNDDGFGMLVFVADHPDTNDTLLFNCRGAADRKP